MNYNREPGRPIYTQQHAISSLKAYLAFKRTQYKYSRFNLYVCMCGGGGGGNYDLELEEKTAYYAHSAR